jgi:hypothetical protein
LWAAKGAAGARKAWADAAKAAGDCVAECRFADAAGLAGTGPESWDGTEGRGLDDCFVGAGVGDIGDFTSM